MAKKVEVDVFSRSHQDVILIRFCMSMWKILNMSEKEYIDGHEYERLFIEAD